MNAAFASPERLTEQRVDWARFRESCLKTCSLDTVKDRVRYARKFKGALFNRDFSGLTGLANSKRNHVLAALSSLSKFLGVYEDFRALVKNSGLTWKTSSVDDLIIARISRTEEKAGVLEWIRDGKAKAPQLSQFLEFAFFSGLRLGEALNSYNLIIELAEKGRLSVYYDFEKEVLEHFRFKSLFLRRNKKAFITLMPRALVLKLLVCRKLTVFQVDNWLKRRRLGSRFGDVREYYATFMTRHLSQPEIDFLQGRVSGSVFMRNYFNPALIKDLKNRVFGGLVEMMQVLDCRGGEMKVEKAKESEGGMPKDCYVLTSFPAEELKKLRGWLANKDTIEISTGKDEILLVNTTKLYPIQEEPKSVDEDLKEQFLEK